MIKFLDKEFVGGQLFTRGMIAEFEAAIEAGLIANGDAVAIEIEASGTIDNAVYAETAGHAETADTALTANTATSATTAGHANTADSATTATTADSSTTADSATTATTAGHATTAGSASIAGHATTATNATYADNATNADHATSADTATSATTATSAGTAATATTATTATNATNAGHATTATNADHATTADTATLALSIDGEIQTYTWNTRPVFAATTVGTIINVSDVGGAGGSFWRATAAGWVPLNNSVLLAQKWATIAAPVATLTGVTDGLFTVTGGFGSLTIPAAMLVVGHTSLHIRAYLHRRGATGTAIARVYIGTAGTSADSQAFFLNFNGDLQDLRTDIDIGVTGASTLTTTSWLTPGSAAANVFRDRTDNINVNSTMIVSFGVASANAADSFDLVGYSVRLQSL